MGVVIELDPGQPYPGPAGPDEPEPPLWTASRRRLVMGVAVVVAASLLAADTAAVLDRAEATPPGFSRPVTVPVSGAPLAVVGDSLYTIAYDGTRLSAYALGTGKRRWSVAIPRLTGPALIDAGPYLLLTTGSGHRTVAVDARSGSTRWQRLGMPVWLSPSGDRVALIAGEPGAGPDSGGQTVVELVTVGTGAPSGAFQPAAKDARVAPVYSADAGGRWMAGMFAREDSTGGQLFDFAAGRTRRLDLPLSRLPADSGAGDRPSFEALLTAGDAIISTTGWGDRSLLTGYAGHPPRQRWSVPDLTTWQAQRCGVLLCSASDQVVLALDAGTGQIRWRSPGTLLWRASGGRLYSSTQVGANASTGIAVLDETTGRELLRRDDWRPVSLVESARVPILAYARTGQVLAVLDARRLTAVHVAVLPQAGADCRAGATHVACRVDPDTFRAWRYAS